MPLDRRGFLTAGLAAAGGAALSVTPWAAAPAQAAASGLRAPAFTRLRPGAVRAQGWLATQLGHQLNGLCGQYPQVSHFLQFDSTGWVHTDQVGWEEVPYWLRGYGDLAYVTGDSTALATAEKWVQAVIATQAPDGFFGPTGLRTSLNGHVDPWPHMPMLSALRSYAEYTGDSSAQNVLARWFAFLATQPTAVFTDGWGYTRWGDTIDAIYWLYDRNGDSSLLDLVRTIHAHSANWGGSSLPTLHNVNIAQGFREPAQYWRLSGNSADHDATYATYNTVQSTYGQFPGGGFAGDENARPGFGDPRQGFETCGIVEYMQSHEILTRLTGDPVWGDRIEELAFNSLPAALDPQGRGTHYITSANSIDLDDVAKTLGQFDNTFAMQSYMAGVDQYRCCPHNYGMGWPFYAEEMWLGTPDGGLCAALYGPSTVTATLGGVSVTVTESTTYPFSDTITFTVKPASPAAFTLQFRVPGWCPSPALSVNGAAVSASAGPSYASVHRTWSSGDTVTLRLPMTPKVRTWSGQHNAASISYGALGFSLAITENWTQTGGSTQFPQYDVHAGSAWNYGLVPGAAISVGTGGNTTDPFTTANAPVKLTTSGQKITAWQADAQSVVTPLQDGPVAATTAVEQITLIPMGAARLRITSFPQTGGTKAWAAAGAAFRIKNKNSGKVLGVDGMSTADSANVVQFTDNGTADHLWHVVDGGGGYVKVVNVNSGKLLAVENMSTANSARVQQFSDSGTADHLWQLIDPGDGWFRLANKNSGKVLGVSNMSTADSAQVVQYDDNGTADHEWLLVPDGQVKVSNVNSGKVLAVENMSTADSARVQQFSDNGTADHVWTFVWDNDGWFRVRNVNSGKVLGVSNMSTADSAQVVQFTDNGSADHLWRLRVLAGGPGTFRVENKNSGKILAVHNASTADSANVEQFQDNGTPDHNWRLL
jgi:hypothetical protein